jgi:hypothetical protein
VGDVADDRGRLRGHFEGDRERIALSQEVAALRPDFELVVFAVWQVGNEDLPDARRDE